ncbi:MAG: AtpZ/AtpI family protein [Phycisphaerales bacterium]|nr:AtpZ/AtpI family protein [Phycisphaerales bacterium]
MEDSDQSPKPSKKDDDSKFYVQGIRYAALAFEFVGTLLILGYVGYKVDAHYDSEPWGLLSGLLIGMGFGLYIMVKQLEKMNR